MNHEFETPGQTSVVIENEVGVVDVECVETDRTEVHLEADSPEAQALVEAATVTCSPVAGGHLVRVLVPKSHRWAWARHEGVSIWLRVPIGTGLDVSTASAGIRVRGQMGQASLRSASGSIVAEDASGSVRAVTASGNITVGVVAKEIRAKTASGDVRIGVADGADVQGVSGNVTIGVLLGEGTVNTVSGNLQVARCHRGRIRAKSVSGDVALGVSPRTSLRVDATSFSGRVSSEIPIGDEGPPSGGTPDLVVTVQTLSGDVRLERAEEPAREVAIPV